MMIDRCLGTWRRWRSRLPIALSASAIVLLVGCSGSSDNEPITPSTLVSTCSQVCANVLSQCGIASTVYEACTNTCNALLLVPNTCITQFAGYLTCLTGATSIQCESGGQTFEIVPGSCTVQESSYEDCNSGPSPLAACIALPSSACQTSAGEGLNGSGMAEFCIGAPDGCTAASSNPLGIGTYCCD